jgi:hypothetical protein
MRWTSSRFRYNEREPSLPAGPTCFQLRAEAGPLLAVRLSLRDEDDGGRRRLSG